MIDNKTLSADFSLLAKLLELHGDNPFKIKAYNNAAYAIKKYDLPVLSLSEEELSAQQGFGKAIVQKILDYIETGKIEALEKQLEKTPAGLIEMLQIKGIGAKKVRTIWKELDITTIGELLYACNENRLTILNGFGAKTQEQIKQKIEFMLTSKGKYHFAAVESVMESYLDALKVKNNNAKIEVGGEYRRNAEVVEHLEFIVQGDEQHFQPTSFPIEDLKTAFHFTDENHFIKDLFLLTGNKNHIGQIKIDPEKKYLSEEEIYKENNLSFIPPEMREGLNEFEWIKSHSATDLIKDEDLKGILHNHSTYSDGLHSLKEMAEYCKSLGYEYFGICDHSQSAFYANGLKPERVLAQQKEIDELNKELAPFKILKGIESDILNDGSLDYEEEILKTFDFIVASVHSNLRMDEEKATNRLLKAIENPFITILGHPTGRLLLSREGYPIDHKKIIDACAANKVVIELNAHPYRLDIDWRWIDYAMRKEVLISINPDAHHKEGLKDMKYGVLVARKGGLVKDFCFNALGLKEIETYFINHS